MKVITPLAILPSYITSGGATEPRSTPADYAAGTTYAFADLVKDPTTHIVYQSLQASNVGNTPSASPLYWQQIGYTETAYSGATFGAGDVVSYNHRVYQSLQAGNTANQPDLVASALWWQDIGPTNRFAMFDTMRNTATVSASPLTVTLTPGQRITSLAGLGLVADTIRIQMTNIGGTIYDKTTTLSQRVGIINGLTYFFNQFILLDSIVAFDLPIDGTAVTTVTLTRSVGNVSCGALVIGQYVDVGAIQYGADDDTNNYSSVTRDAYGNATLIPRRNVPKLDITTWTAKSNAPALRALRDSLNAVPAVWSGLDDNTDGFFPSLLILGIFQQFKINLAYTDYAIVTLELEEI